MTTRLIGINPVERHSDGIHTWTEDEIATFRSVFPIGTRQRLAFELMLNTAQRRADVVRMGWQHIENGKIRVRQQKTGVALEIGIHPDLQRVLDEMPRTQYSSGE